MQHVHLSPSSQSVFPPYFRKPLRLFLLFIPQDRSLSWSYISIPPHLLSVCIPSIFWMCSDRLIVFLNSLLTSVDFVHKLLLPVYAYTVSRQYTVSIPFVLLSHLGSLFHTISWIKKHAFESKNSGFSIGVRFSQPFQFVFNGPLFLLYYSTHIVASRSTWPIFYLYLFESLPDRRTAKFFFH